MFHSSKTPLIYSELTLPHSTAARQRRSPLHLYRLHLALAVLTIFFILACHTLPSILHYDDSDDCPQPEPLFPQTRKDITEKNYDGLFKNEEEWRRKASERLADAVKIRTETFDFLRDVPPKEGEDIPERKGLVEFRDWLEKAFPLVHKTLSREIVNQYALLFTWKGSDSSAKPLVLCAHIDTVPVPESSLDQWERPPFSGHIDDKYIWGRGSVDTKNTLVAIVEAVESLIAAGLEPKRTVILAFGFDEEISGYHGAKALSKAMLERGLKDNVELLVDEGPGIKTVMGATIAHIGVSEKGYMDVTVSVSTPGGHSSIPPDHTGIGILSLLITRLEENPYDPALTDESPFLAYLRCGAKWAPDMGQWLRTAIRKINIFRPALVKYLAKDRQTRYQMQTSQAVDVVNGGVKLNALPEFAQAQVNHRIAPHMNVSEVGTHLRHTLLPVGEKFGLGFVYTDHTGKNWTNSAELNDDDQEWKGTVHVQTYHGALEPAPISPSEGKAWDLLAGTVRRVSQDEWSLHGKKDNEETDGSVIVAPVLMPANTDTRYYWDLTRNIYRFNPVRDEKEFGVHTVNERIAIEAHVESVAFYHELIRNFEEME